MARQRDEADAVNGTGVTFKSNNEPASTSVAYPALHSRHVVLRAVAQYDYEFLRAVELSETLGPRWRHEGRTTPPEVFAQTLWNGVAAQFLVIRRTSQERLGILACYDLDLRNGFAYFGGAKFDRGSRSPDFVEGSVLFIEYVFACWPLRKLYLQVAEYNLDQIGSGVGRLLTEEGRLREHRFFAGRYWDEVMVSIDRASWERKGLYKLVSTRPRPPSITNGRDRD